MNFQVSNQIHEKKVNKSQKSISFTKTTTTTTRKTEVAQRLLHRVSETDEEIS